MESTGALYFKAANNGWISNEGSTDYYTYWVIPLPTTKGALDLYIDDLKLLIAATDGNDDVVQDVYYFGLNGTSVTTIAGKSELVSSPTEKIYYFSSYNVSTYDAVIVRIYTKGGTAANIKHSMPIVKYWYA